MMCRGVENLNQVVYRIGCWYQMFVVQYQMSSIRYWAIFISVHPYLTLCCVVCGCLTTVRKVLLDCPVVCI